MSLSSFSRFGGRRGNWEIEEEDEEDEEEEEEGEEGDIKFVRNRLEGDSRK